jgi:dihydrofolate synthase / folylpolyglutamate synthase
MKSQRAEKMVIQGLKSKIITSGDDLISVVRASLKNRRPKEGDILVITSKVVAVTQGRVKKIRNQADFDRLVAVEADRVIGKDIVTLTLNKGIFIPWAGIDRSNIPEGQVVLWPEEPFEVAHDLCRNLKKIYRLKKLGIIISDSHCTPLRAGIVGIAIGYAGFKGVNDLRGKKDLYGNILKVTRQNMADLLSSAAHLAMGEAAESTPFCVISGAPVHFTTQKVDPNEPLISLDECLFRSLYKKNL